jgi:hypothetical protein
MSKATKTVFDPVVSPKIGAAVVESFAKSELSISKAVAAATASRGKAINKLLDAMYVACDKPKDVFLKGNAATNAARFQVKSVFDEIVAAGNLTAATAATYATCFWIAFEKGIAWSPDLANKKTEATQAATTAATTATPTATPTAATTATPTATPTAATTAATTATPDPRRAGTPSVINVPELHRSISLTLAQSRALNQTVFSTALLELTLSIWPDFKETILSK